LPGEGYRRAVQKKNQKHTKNKKNTNPLYIELERWESQGRVTSAAAVPSLRERRGGQRFRSIGRGSRKGDDSSEKEEKLETGGERDEPKMEKGKDPIFRENFCLGGGIIVKGEGGTEGLMQRASKRGRNEKSPLQNPRPDRKNGRTRIWAGRCPGGFSEKGILFHRNITRLVTWE